MKPSALTELLRDRPSVRAIQTDPRTVAALASPASAPKRPARPEVADVVVTRTPTGVTVLAKGLRLVNGLNSREHWRARAARAASERELIAAALAPVPAPAPPLVVTVTRRGPRALDDDGATASAKHVRDAVAAWLGVDDGDGRVRYVVQQARERGYGVTVEVARG